MRPPHLADVAVPGRLKARLPHTRVQPKVAHQLLRRRKARDVTDGGEQADRHDAVHARDRQQPLELIVVKNALAQVLVDGFEVLTKPVKFSQALLDCLPFVHWQRLLGQPHAPLAAKQVGGRALRDQVRGQDCVDLVLQTRAMANNLGTTSDLSAKRLRAIVGHPHLRQEAAGVQLGQDCSVDLVRLDTSFRDQPHLHRVGNHDLGNVWLERRYDGGGIARGLQNHFVAGPQPFGKSLQRLVLQGDSTTRVHLAFFEVGDLAEGSRDVQSYNSHHQLLALG